MPITSGLLACPSSIRSCGSARQSPAVACAGGAPCTKVCLLRDWGSALRGQARRQVRGGECGQRANYRIYCAAHSEPQRRKDLEVAERGGGAPRAAAPRRAPDQRRRERAPAADRARLAALQALQARAGLPWIRAEAGVAACVWGSREERARAARCRRRSRRAARHPRQGAGDGLSWVPSGAGAVVHPCASRALARASASPRPCERRAAHGAGRRPSRHAAARPPQKAAGMWRAALGPSKACAPRRRAAA
jgi:hypothetical protein